jgi:hypothetical protein
MSPEAIDKSFIFGSNQTNIALGPPFSTVSTQWTSLLFIANLDRVSSAFI